MKEENEHQFTPDQIDEQIEEQLIDRSHTTPEARFLAEMQQVTQYVRQEHEQALTRVEDRLLKYTLTRAEHSAFLPGERPQRSSSVRKVQQGGSHIMEQQKRSSGTRRNNFGRSLSLLIAIVMLTVLVGSLVLIQSKARQGLTTQTGTHVAATAIPTATPAPKPVPEGTVVYSTRPGSSSLFAGFSELAWSPDSKRIASLDSQGVLKIWDATTGKHAITIPMSGQDKALDISWSPDGSLLAVATGAHILIINSQSGARVRTYTAPTTTASISSGSRYLSAMLPESGDTSGFNAVAWSPDGRWLATSSTISPPVFITRVLDAQTGVVAFTLPGGGGGASSFAWSSDSLYLSALAFNNTGSEYPVWSISTRQKVAGYPEGGSAGPAWQPGTHNLALVKSIAKADGGYGSAIVIWNALTGKVIRQFSVAQEDFASGSIAWSPDGQRLVYGITPTEKQQKDIAVIINPKTGQRLYTYPGGDQHSGALVAWSPDDKYIVSGTGGSYSSDEAKPSAQVWIA